MRPELLLLALHQRIGSVEHQAGWSIGNCRQPLPGDAVKAPIGRGVHHLPLARRRDATVADATAEQSEGRMLVVDDAVVLVAPVPGGDCLLLEQVGERVLQVGSLLVEPRERLVM